MSIAAYDPSRTSLTLANGQGFDLLDPKPELVDFLVLIEQLAKANRYCGATPGLIYSVAEHSERCARAALDADDDEELAKYLLLHDMHEALLGDDTTPKKRALAVIIGSFGVLAGTIEQAFAQLTERIDIAIHARAGLAWPPAGEMAAKIHHFDRVLLATEWRDLMRCPQPYDFGVAPLAEAIEPEPDWNIAAAGMERMCRQLFGDGIFNNGGDHAA